MKINYRKLSFNVNNLVVFLCSGLHFCNMLFALTQFSYDPINVHLNNVVSENAYNLSNHFIFIK